MAATLVTMQLDHRQFSLRVGVLLIIRGVVLFVNVPERLHYACALGGCFRPAGRQLNRSELTFICCSHCGCSTRLTGCLCNVVIIPFVSLALLHAIHFSDDWNFKRLKKMYINFNQLVRATNILFPH